MCVCTTMHTSEPALLASGCPYTTGQMCPSMYVNLWLELSWFLYEMGLCDEPCLPRFVTSCVEAAACKGNEGESDLVSQCIPGQGKRLRTRGF